VGYHTISESRKHTRLNGFDAPPFKKLKFHHLKFKLEQIDQFDHFFMRKDIVNISSYRNHSKSGLPIMYLQDHKQASWKKFSEEYSNGM
ncbi:3090_t:CDS:1, partial [Rhizophagus irregularis]